MLKERINQYISDELKKNQGLQTINLFQEEREFAQTHNLLPTEISIEVMNPASRFQDAYIERGDKETEDTLAKEVPEFLNNPIDYFKKHKNEFLYVESNWFELIRVEAVSFEVDDVFDTYDVMLGLKLPKKFGPSIKEQVKQQLDNEGATFDLVFSNEDGLWDFNFALNNVPDFREDMTIAEAYSLIYGFLFQLVGESVA